MLKEKVSSFVTNEQLANLYSLIQSHGDDQNAEKLLDLYEKQKNNEFVISFSGHFSAGKSSLLNYIIGKDVLPKSPIPTSANIVKITSGEGVARVYFNNEKTVQYNEPYDIDMIKDYCMDRDTIKQIEINTKEHILPAQTFLVDTPGIDAADDADRLMTESSLHMIDTLFYVMDYNHVQSEVNLQFLQEIQDANIPFYIVINQIDKHNEAEIPFLQYESRVKQTFEQWHIKPERLFYSSTLNEDVAYSELREIKDFVYTLLDEKNNIDRQITNATKVILADHKVFLQDQYEAELKDINSDDYQSLTELEDTLSSLQSFQADFHDEFIEEVNHTLNNAYLMPAQLRDLAEHFLQSQQKDFKLGGFFRAKKKTEEEKELRLKTFLQELQKTIQSTIQWRLRDKLSELLRDKQIHEESLFARIQELKLDYTEEDLLKLVNPGATVNGNYVLNYTNEISGHIKTLYRQQTNELWEKVSEFIGEKNKSEIESLKEQVELAKNYVHLAEENEELRKQLNETIEQVDHILKTDKIDHDYIEILEELIEERHDVVIEDVPVLKAEEEKDTEIFEKAEAKEQASSHSTDFIINSIDKVINTVKDVSGFNDIIAELKDKQDRLNNRDLTIALFGAFSAGKSSFSNALFGEHILPVSPNPTTAVINRISPVTDEYTHGTVLISLKDNDMLTKDLNSMLSDFNINESDFHVLIKHIKEKKLYEDDDLNKMYQAYLAALIEGYEEQKDKIGSQITIELSDFEAYVTDEAKACYVESVDLFYDCDLTRQGITIVDTPGADSINARHTNVAFDYIKYADAILYVTYYNHAITSADRDFLMQLGRVKESFELDKMFFIVNAADLAEDEQELELVLNYVKEQLLQFGIRFPNVYPVSSKKSLKEKQNKADLNEQMARFEESFYSFIHKDLAQLTIQSAIWDMTRTEKLLQNYIKTVSLNKDEQTDLIQSLTEKKGQVANIIQALNVARLKEQVQERINRQLHYVNERLYIRFHDLFTEHFNPTTITESGQQGMKQINKNSRAFIDYVGYELLQEVRAVSLRLEAHINTLLSQFHDQLSDEISKIDDSFVLASYTSVDLKTPTYEQAFINLDKNILSPAMKIFRSTKAFFEQNDREKMKDAFYDILKEPASSYIAGIEEMMIASYTEETEKLADRLKEKITEDVNSIITNQLQLLDTDIDIDKLKDKASVINNLIKEM